MIEPYLKFVNMLQTNSQNHKYQRSLPSNYTIEDVFLVSFPKSGNTWLRFLIANTIKLHYQIDREINFFTIQDIIPGIKGTREIKSKSTFGLTHLPRILKSHAAYNPHYHRVILLIRNPRDTIISYYFYQKSYREIPESMTISEFIRSKKHGVENWIFHTNSWYFSNKKGQIIRIFRYEDLLENTKKQLFLIMDLLGLSIKDSILQQAIQLSSREIMSKSEYKHRSNYILKSQTTPFVAQNKLDRNKVLSNEDNEYIRDITKDIATELGYSI